MPGSVLLDLARRYGGKVRSGTATTCRFLLEAPPLGYVVQQGAGHRTTLGAITGGSGLEAPLRCMGPSVSDPERPGAGRFICLIREQNRGHLVYDAIALVRKGLRPGFSDYYLALCDRPCSCVPVRLRRRSLPLIVPRTLQQHRSARMARLFIVVGDRLSSGGSVLTGSPFTDIEGRPMARVGDRTICPTHGPGTIITGDATLIVDGNAAARQGDRASCGCSLIAGRQNLVFVDQGVASTPSAQAPPTATTRQAGATSNIPAESPDRRSTLRSRRRASVCWAEDHEIEVATNAHGRYYLVHDENGNPLDLSLQRKFKISVPLKSTGDVEVLVRIKATAAQTGSGAGATVSQEDMDAAKSRMEAGIQTLWDNKFTLEIFDAPCGTKTFPIVFKVEWVARGHHYAMNVSPSQLREHVVNMNINVWKDTTTWTFAHEYAHCFGVADEYSYDRMNAWTLRYYRPDGTLSPDALQIPANKADDDPGATIMSTQNNTSVELRHAWQIALEVQAFLARHTGRRIECSVR